jgi:hypothetical protein
MCFVRLSGRGFQSSRRADQRLDRVTLLYERFEELFGRATGYGDLGNHLALPDFRSQGEVNARTTERNRVDVLRSGRSQSRKLTGRLERRADQGPTVPTLRSDEAGEVAGE